MQFLKQSTASQSVLIGPFVDSTDGVTAETALTIAAADVRLSKNGGNIVAKNSGGGTHDEIGYYTVTLDATDTDTVGRLQLMVNESGALPVYHEFTVLEENVYDALFGSGADAFDASARVKGIAGTTNTLDGLNDVSAADVNAQCDAAIETYGLDHLLSASVTGTDVANNSVIARLVSSSATADWDTFDNTTDALQAIADSGGGGPTAAQIADAVWDEATAGHTTAGTFGEQVKTDIDAILTDTGEIGAAGAGLTGVPWNSAWDAEVQSEVNDALVALHLDHLLAADYDPASKPGAATALMNELVESDGGVSRFTTNALEQAPTGGSAPTAAAVADAVWDEAQADHVAAGSFGEMASEIASILADTNELQTDDVPGLIAALNDPAASAIADAVLDEVVEGSYTLRQLMRLFASALLGQLSGAATATNTFRDLANSKNRITATVDGDGNRTAVSLDGT